MIFKCLLLNILCVILHQNVAVVNGKKNVVCYHGTWSAGRKSLGKFNVATDIDPFLCTHLIYAFIDVAENGELKHKDPHLDLDANSGLGNIRKFNALKLKNPKLKTLMAAGGGSASSKTFSNIAADPTKRARFIQSAIRFIKIHGFDGLDMDWEYPSKRHNLKNKDRENFVTWLKELKNEFKQYGYILTAAVGLADGFPERSYLISEVAKYLDLINIMAYDFHGPWESVVGINAPLYPGPLDKTENAKQHSFASIAKYWISHGAPRHKLVMGVPFYGQTYTLKDPNNHKVGSPHIGPGKAGPYTGQPGVLGYNEICEKFKKAKSKWNLKWEPTQMVPYAYSGNQWIGYENKRSINLKVDYVKKENLGGIMIWAIDMDDFRGVCGPKRYPLLTAINKKLFA